MFSIVVQNHVKGSKKILSYQLAAKALKVSTNSANSDDPYRWIGGFLQQILCYSVSFVCVNFVPLTRFLIKVAGASEAGSQTNERALFPNETFRHQKLLKIRPNHDQIKSKIFSHPLGCDKAHQAISRWIGLACSHAVPFGLDLAIK